MICLGNTPVKPFIFTAARSVPADILYCPLSPLLLLVIAATYVRFIKRPPTVDCCRRNATRAISVISEQKDDTPPTPRSMGHVTHVLACRRLPPMLLLLAFRIAFVLLLLNPANRHHPLQPAAALRAFLFWAAKCAIFPQFMSSFSSKYLHQLRATVVMHMPGLSSFVLLHIYIL